LIYMNYYHYFTQGDLAISVSAFLKDDLVSRPLTSCPF